MLLINLRDAYRANRGVFIYMRYDCLSYNDPGWLETHIRVNEDYEHVREETKRVTDD